MNEFQSVESGEGLLKPEFAGRPKLSPLEEALKRKRKKLKKSLLGENEEIVDQLNEETAEA